MELRIERVYEECRKEVLDIFNYYIKNTTAAYREDIVDDSFFDDLFEDAIGDAKYIMKIGEEIIGFCLLEYFMPIRTFREVAEVTYFIKKEYIGRGIGKMALEILEQDAKQKGIKTIVANITSDNKGSIRFHEKNGFIKYGELENAGIKFGRYFNIIYMKKNIA